MCRETSRISHLFVLAVLLPVLASGGLITSAETSTNGLIGEGTSPPFSLYLGPGFAGPPAVLIGEGTSAAFSLWLGPMNQSWGLSPAFAIDTRSTIPASFSGVVRAVGSGSVVPGALVQLFLGSQVLYTTTSDVEGKYEFLAIPFGDYVVQASKSGYGAAASDLVHWTGQSSVHADLSLPGLPGPGLPDLALGATDLTYTVLETGTLTLTAMVHNNGGTSASGVRVRFYDASTGSGINEYVKIDPDVVLQSVGPGEVKAASVSWTPSSAYQKFYVFVDPLNSIKESSEINNSASRELGVLGRVAPRVNGVTAQYDGLSDPKLIGRFLSGIEGAENRFTATVSDADNDLVRVRFDFNGTVLEDTNPADGWSVSFDVGTLPAGNLALTVTAFDASGLQSEPYVVTLVVGDWPWWMTGRLQLEKVLPVGFGREPGYLTFTLRLKNEETTDIALLVFQDLIDPDVLIVGLTSIEFKENIYLTFYYPVDSRLAWKVEGKVKIKTEVFGQGEREWELILTCSVSPDGSQLESIAVEGSLELAIPALPEVYSPSLCVAYGVVCFDVGLSMDVLVKAMASGTLQVNLGQIDVSLGGQVGARVNGILRVSDPIKFGRLELVLSPQALWGPELRYVYPPPNFSVSGQYSFLIGGRVTGSIIWGRASKDLLTWTWGPWEGTYPKLTGPPSMPLAFATLPDSVYLPAVFPYPASASGKQGQVGVVWIADVDADPLRVDPEVFFAIRDSIGTWHDPERVTTNDRFESVPAVSFLSDGRAVAAWVQSSLLEPEANQPLSLSNILDRQDIWYAVRGESGWSQPSPVIEDTQPPYRADGLPSLAGLESEGAMLTWARSVGDSALAPGSGEIYFSKFSGVDWSAPASITNDSADDLSPFVCALRGDSALVVWVREDPPGSGNQEVMWSTWNGSAWSAHEILRDVGNKRTSPSVVMAPGGDVLATWVEVETLPDSTLRYHVMAKRKPNGQATWGGAEEVALDSLFIETPVPLVDQRNIAAVLWRGYDGYDGDLKVALKDLDEPASAWTLPRSVTADTLTDWMVTAALDRQNNLHVIDLKSDLKNPPGASMRNNFFDGLSIASRGISNDLSLTDQLNFGYRPLSADLRLAAGSVWLGGFYPAVGDTAHVNARVENIGDVRSMPSTVRFYDGHPDSGGVVIADVSLPAVSPDSTFTATAAWIVSSGMHKLHGVADPMGNVPEQNEANNIAYVKVSVLPDLTVCSVTVSKPNPSPGDSVDVAAMVANTGGVGANDFSVRFARRTGTLATVSSLSAAPAETITVTSHLIAEAGVDTLTATADPDSVLPDPDRSRNRASFEFLVLPDLVVPSDSISYAGSDSVGVLSAVVENQGGVASPSFLVSFYRGNPIAGGTSIDSVRVSSVAARSSVRVSVPWFAPLGRSTIYLIADSLEEVAERSEGNNESFGDVIRGALADLVVVPGSFTACWGVGDTLIIEAAFANTGMANALGVGVEFFLSHPDSGGMLIGDRLLIALELGDTTIVSIPWAEPDYVGNAVYAIVDRANAIPELDEGNNYSRVECATTVAVPDKKLPVLPTVLALHQSHPNPFSSQTTIRFDLPTSVQTSLIVYDVMGRVVRKLISGVTPAGFHAIQWDGVDERGHKVSSGVYVYRLEAHGKALSRKLVVLR
ncbi:MAG: CARDB domain-containing protein [Candidatus Eisenbacteria bacterium]|nr:CARDB domain-containing protein [Candidatus Eisenbacteria bacterium]